MTPEAARVMIPSTRTRKWVLFGRSPEGNFKCFARHAAPAENEDELFDRLRQHIHHDPDFAVKHDGWFFFVADLSRGIECKPVVPLIS